MIDVTLPTLEPLPPENARFRNPLRLPLSRLASPLQAPNRRSSPGHVFAADILQLKEISCVCPIEAHRPPAISLPFGLYRVAKFDDFFSLRPKLDVPAELTVILVGSGRLIRKLRLIHHDVGGFGDRELIVHQELDRIRAKILT